jgi:hypothetical protein
MNTSKIHKGQRFSNYKTLCEVLSEPILGGSSKTSQLKRWELYFSWDKVGHAFIIKNIFLEPLVRQKNSDLEKKAFLILFSLLEEVQGKENDEVISTYRTYKDLQ